MGHMVSGINHITENISPIKYRMAHMILHKLYIAEKNNLGHIACPMRSHHKLFFKSGANNSLQDRLTPQSTPNNPTTVSGRVFSI